jgi:ATP-dependent RNA helicase RhlB
LQVSRPVIETTTQPDQHLTDLKFDDLPLSASLKRSIAEAGFTYCTPIQGQTLPLALDGQDVAGQAQTGTGKTAAFLIALFHKLENTPPVNPGQPGPRALVLAPTRELAVQIHADAEVLVKYLPFKLGLAFGGTDYDKQRDRLAAGVDVLIGTPGRIIDYFKQRVFHLRGAQVLVLDEADRMFDLGFIKDIRFLLRRLPEHDMRLNMLFSATLSYRVLELAYEHMNDPELVRIEPDKMTVDRVTQAIYFPANDEKLPLLLKLLSDMDPRRTMIFVNTRREAERLRDRLERHGIQAAALSGDVPQRKRLRMLKDFQSGQLPVLIGTDVAGRGLHVPGVSHVFNYDLPQDAEDYVHRIGRTARAGAAGDAISFGCEGYVMSLPEIEDFIGRKIPVASFDHEELRTFMAASRAAARKPRPRPAPADERDDSDEGETQSRAPATTAGAGAGPNDAKPGTAANAPAGQGSKRRRRSSRRRGGGGGGGRSGGAPPPRSN